MPVNYNANADAYPESAFFSDQPLLDDIIASLPGLIGAWDAADWSGSGSWVARVGGGSIVPALSGVTPFLTSRSGRAVMRFGLTSKAWVKDAAGGDPLFSGLTFASRAYYGNETANFQKIADLGAPELYFRSTLTPKIWQFAGLGAAGTTPIAAPIVGWHNVFFAKTGTDAAIFAADGGTEVAFGSAGNALAGATLQLGDAASASSAECDHARIIICNSGALTAQQRGAARAWLGL